MKKILIAIMALTLTFTLNSCKKSPSGERTSSTNPTPPLVEPAENAAPEQWDEWAAWVDKQHSVGDDQGHGPDIGSDEWAYALNHQLKISDEDGHGPDIGSSEWRRAVERKLLQQ